MQLPVLLSYLLAALQVVFAAPPPEHERVLVIVDESNPDVEASSLADPLRQRGFDVEVSSIKDRPELIRYGERRVDNVIIVPGKTKALGSTLTSAGLLEFMELGGNIVALTTPKYNPAALRELAAQLGIEVASRGVESRNEFGHAPVFPHSPILNAGDVESSLLDLFSGSSVAKLNDANDLTLGLVQAPYSAYSYNAAKEGSGDGEELIRPVADAFALGSDMFASAALQSLRGSRFVWVGATQLLTNPAAAEAITSWAFQERGRLRVANATHLGAHTGESHLHYMVEEPLRFCAQIEQWVPELKGWIPYENIDDVQFEFKMLDPYYRLHLGKDGCVEFKAPDQYGMFTFQIDYKRPGLSFLDEKQVVTIRHRANDEWDRSWTIPNSWVYLSGISTTVIGFIIFVFIYLATPAPTAADHTKAKAAAKPSKEVPAVAKATSVKEVKEEPKRPRRKARG